MPLHNESLLVCSQICIAIRAVVVGITATICAIWNANAWPANEKAQY